VDFKLLSPKSYTLRPPAYGCYWTPPLAISTCTAADLFVSCFTTSAAVNYAAVLIPSAIPLPLGTDLERRVVGMHHDLKEKCFPHHDALI
jgi:hypothetical protein